jgi:hypothetical protein
MTPILDVHHMTPTDLNFENQFPCSLSHRMRVHWHWRLQVCKRVLFPNFSLYCILESFRTKYRLFLLGVDVEI